MNDLAIIIVNFNSGHDVFRCLRSLESVRDEVTRQIIVVDNGSSDGSCERIAAEYPRAELLRAGENLGFAAACNLGMEQASARHVLLLNPDTEVRAGALAAMTGALDNHPHWGIVGARMLDSTGQPYRAARRFPTPFDLFCEQVHLARLFPRSRRFAGYFYGDRELDSLDAVDQVEGSALMISDAARKSVGNLDPRFFVFFEEVDWCRRVKAAGFEIHVVPTACIVHHRATTMSRYFVQSRIYNARSALAYFRKHHGPRGARSLRRWVIAASYCREAAAMPVWLLTRDAAMRRRVEGARAERAVYAADGASGA